MKQEDKELLLKYLCMALPYKVICEDMEGKTRPLFGITPTQHFIVTLDNATDGTNGLKFCTIDCIKPYLRPISSMTEEEFEDLKSYSGLKYEQLDLASFQNGTYKCLDFYLSEIPSDVVILVFDWLNARHFDYRGLIPMGLAIEVTKENNPYERID